MQTKKEEKPTMIHMADGSKIPLPQGAMHIERRGKARHLILNGKDAGPLSNMHLGSLEALARKHHHLP